MNWTPSTIAALLATIVVGALVTLQPPVNSELGRRTGDLGAAFVSVSVTFAILGVAMLLFGDFSSLSRLRGVPLIYLTGGIYGALFVAATLVTVRYLGAGVTIAVLVAVQLIVAAMLDHFGLLGLDVVALSPARVIGICVLIAGTILVTLH
ncbi:MAG: DMT family transporter [Solirubrobacterales bacterium]